MNDKKLSGEQTFEHLSMSYSSMASTLTKKAQGAKITVLHCSTHRDEMNRLAYEVLYMREPYVLDQQSGLFS